MLKIRLQRVGRKNDPSFRVVLTDSKNATRSGKFLEILGSYSARQGEPVINGDRVKYWMSVGAKPSDTVHNLLITKKVITGKKVNVLPKKTVPKKEGEPASAQGSDEAKKEEKVEIGIASE
jgi:small subunit ribosomal protein S16